MTREEAITRLKNTAWLLKNTAWLYRNIEREQNIEAINMAIEALSAEHKHCWNCKHYEPRYNVCHAPEVVKQVTSKLKNSCDSLLADDNDNSKEQKSKLDLISRADAIEAISQDIMGGLNYERILAELPSVSAERVGEWIPCEEKEAEFPCLISDAHGNIPSIPHGIVTITDKKHGTWQIDGRLCDEARLLVDGEVGDVCNWHNRIVAWMPLPEPYCPSCGAKMKGGAE